MNLVLSLEKGKEVHPFQQENPTFYTSGLNDSTMQTESMLPISKDEFNMNKFIMNMNRKINNAKKRSRVRNVENEKKPIN